MLFPCHADVLHDFTLGRVGLHILNQEGILPPVFQKNQKRACLLMVRHVHTNILGNGCQHNDSIFVNIVDFIHVEQLRKILHLCHIHLRLLLPVEHIGCRLCPGQIILVETFVHQFQLFLIIFKGMYDLFYFNIECVQLLVFQSMPAE